MASQARVIGIHLIEADEPIYLVEIEIDRDADSFDFGEITQEAVGQPRSNWQVAYGEQPVGKNRFAFFFIIWIQPNHY